MRVDKNCDYLIFSFEDKIVIKYDDDKEYSIEKNILYFAKKGFEVVNNDDNVIYIKCEYFETKDKILLIKIKLKCLYLILIIH